MITVNTLLFWLMCAALPMVGFGLWIVADLLLNKPAPRNQEPDDVDPY